MLQRNIQRDYIQRGKIHRKERYISPEKGQQIFDELRLV